MSRNRRRWTATSTQGPTEDAQIVEVGVYHSVFLDDAGEVVMPVPKLSAMFLNLAEAHARNAKKIRSRAMENVQADRSEFASSAESSVFLTIPETSRNISQTSQTIIIKRFLDDELALDFLQEAVAAVVLTCTALDNFASELMPGNFSCPDATGRLIPRTQIERHWGIAKRLTIVLPKITQESSIEEARPEIWSALETLWQLRHDVVHIHHEESYTALGQDAKDGLFSRLFEVDLSRFIAVVEQVIEYYSHPSSKGEIECPNCGKHFSPVDHVLKQLLRDKTV